MGSWRQAVRYSQCGHGWVVWVSTAGTLLACLLSWLPVAVALLAVELTAVASLIAQDRRRRRHG
jgi:hypothetical protein